MVCRHQHNIGGIGGKGKRIQDREAKERVNSAWLVYTFPFLLKTQTEKSNSSRKARPQAQILFQCSGKHVIPGPSALGHLCTNQPTLSQNFRSLALTVLEWRCFEDYEEMGHGLNKQINHKTVCRTAPATPGLSFTTSCQVLQIKRKVFFT